MMVASSPMASLVSPTICHTQRSVWRLAGALINGQDDTPHRPHPFLPPPEAALGQNSPTPGLWCGFPLPVYKMGGRRLRPDFRFPRFRRPLRFSGL